MALTRFMTTTVSSLLIWLLFFGGHGLAAPNVSSVSGTLTHGSDATISGSSFGPKGGSDPNKPLIWADFEASINPTNLGVVTSWTSNNNLSLYTGFPQHGLSTQSVRGTWPGTGLNKFYFIVTRNFSTTRKSYLYGKRYMDFSQGGNYKFFRMWATGDATSFGTSTVSGGLINWDNCTTDPNRYDSVSLLTNAWQIDEFRVDLGTVDNCAANTGNGLYEYVINGARHQLDSSLSTGNSSGFTYGEHQLLHNFTPLGPESPPNGSHVYMDDLYLDDTWAHVMIGNASTFAASTVREIQIPKAWADGSITVTVNRGSFASLANRYLYVIDANGQVNANGFLLCPSPCQGAPVPPSQYPAQ